ncbi:MAG TPA: hypothetical protein VD867_05305 [Burkholderiales bacterium]|nr:hypothetical protein [Burkholderiales bacterium]
MDFYQASILRVDGRYLLTSVSNVGNPLKIRVDHLTSYDGWGKPNGVVSVMRQAVAPQDAMRAWDWVDPRELLERYSAHCARERRRIEAAFKKLDDDEPIY